MKNGLAAPVSASYPVKECHHQSYPWCACAPKSWQASRAMSCLLNPVLTVISGGLSCFLYIEYKYRKNVAGKHFMESHFSKSDYNCVTRLNFRNPDKQ